jgi:tetratricopeptide (TPR) repeat protein
MKDLLASNRSIGKRWGVAFLMALLALVPATAEAQKDAFTDAFFEFHSLLSGTYGDEGALIESALDKMGRALAEWDRIIQALEARLQVQSADAPANVTYQMHVTLGRMYAERGRFADALRELDTASLLDPKRVEPHVLRGLVLQAFGRFAESGAAFRSAASLDASDPVTTYHVLRYAAASDDAEHAQRARETAAAAYQRLLRDGAHATSPGFVRLELFQDRRADDTPVVPLVAYANGYEHIGRGEYDSAIAEFRKAAASDPLITDRAARSASFMQGVAALRKGRLADARSALEGTAALTDSSEAHRVLGLVYWADSQDEKSIEQLEIAIQRNPRDERSRLMLARVLTSAGRDSDAERALQDTLAVLPDSALAHWWLGSGYERLARFAAARQEFELVSVDAIAGRGRLDASIGRLAGNARDFPGAIEAFARSVIANPGDPTVHKQLAAVFLQQDRAEDAFVELVAALLIDPLDAGAHAGIGQIHLNAGRYNEAVDAVRRAVELSADYTEARYTLATALMRSGNTQDAAREFERVERAQRQMLADQRRNMALDVLKEEAALRTAEGNYDRAAALWQKVIDREPDRSSNHLGLAAALIGAGRIDAAITHYERAVTLGADSVVYRQLAELYGKVGRLEEAARARVTYERALQGNSHGSTPR